MMRLPLTLFFAVSSLVDVGSPDQARIIGGWHIGVKDAPYHATVAYWESKAENGVVGAYRYRCGGSIVNEWWILTAGQCLVAYSKIFPKKILREDQVGVIIARDNKNFSNQWLENPFLGVMQVVVHPRYLQGITPEYHDIGLVGLLRSPLTWRESVMPVILPNSSFYPQVDTQACFTGMGWSHVYNNIIDYRLKAHCGWFIDYKFCNPPKHPYSGQNLPRLCFTRGSSPSRGCFGDAGGGLVKKLPNGSFLIVGIYSDFDAGPVEGLRWCIGPKEYFINVAYYLSWIQKIIRDKPVYTKSAL